MTPRPEDDVPDFDDDEDVELDPMTDEEQAAWAAEVDAAAQAFADAEKT